MIYYYPCKPNQIDKDSDMFKSLDKDSGWIAEVKKDGWRCMAYRDKKVTLWTRHKTLITKDTDTINKRLLELPENTIIDGEFINNRTKNVKGIYYVFDILMHKGTLLVNVPFSKRRKILETVMPFDSAVQLAQQIQVGKIKLFRDCLRSEENEGIVIKKLSSKYLVSLTSCQQNPMWIKVKEK